MVRAGVTLNLTVTVGAFEKVVSEQGHEGHEKYTNVEIWGQSCCRPAKVAVRPACLRAVGCAEGTGVGSGEQVGRSKRTPIRPGLCSGGLGAHRYDLPLVSKVPGCSVENMPWGADF